MGFAAERDVIACGSVRDLRVSHVQGNLQEAIDNYHRALSWRPEDTFTADMLTIAVKECADQDFVLMG